MEDLRTRSLRVEAFAAILFLAACSEQSGTALTPPAASPAFATTSSKLAGRGLLYAADSYGSGVAAIRTSDATMLYRITNGIHSPAALALDSARNLYVANSQTVTVYKPGSRVPSLTIGGGIDRPTGLAVDANGTVYVANRGNTVAVFKAGSSSRAYSIRTGIDGPAALAIDKSGNLYVANASGNSVSVYAPRGRSALRTIKDHVRAPIGLAFDRTGNLYVTNQSTRMVTVYKPKSRTAWYATSAVGELESVALDGAGKLYATGSQAPGGNAGAVFAPGSATPSYLLGNLAPSDTYGGLAVERSGRAYLADLTTGVILVFKPGSPSFNFPGIQAYGNVLLVSE
jgi:sugar lactone lactonase YvrE